MKATLTILCLLLLTASCKNDAPSDAYPVTEPDVSRSLKGTWQLIGFYNYVDDKVVDSFGTQEGYRQVKMYSDTKVMWSKHVPNDSTEWFGYGTYKMEDDKLTEILEYGSEMMTKIIQERKEFTYEIEFNNDTFSQIEIDEDGHRIYSENYKRIE